MMPLPRKYVDPPLFTNSQYGLLSVAQLVDDSDSHWEGGIDFQPNCVDSSVTCEPCYNDGTSSATKTPTGGFPTRGALPFTVYAEIDCGPVGGTWEQIEARTNAALTQSESWSVENAFWTGQSDCGTTVFPHLAANAAVVSGTAYPVEIQTAAMPVTGVVLDVVEGLGMLESALATCYNGVGVIHIPRVLVPHFVLHGQLVKDGPRYRTWNGNLVAVGSGYDGSGPDGTTDVGKTWMYATGAVFYRRSPIKIISTKQQALDRSTNSMVYIAERTYVMAWDCCHYAVQVSTGGFITGQPNSAF